MDQGKLSNRSSRNNASQSASRSESAAVSASARTSKKPVLFVAAVSKKPVLFVAAVVMILLVSFQYHQCLCPSNPPAPCPAIKAGGSNEENEANKKIVIDAVKGWEDGIDFEVDHHTRWTKGEMDSTKKGWFKYERETKLKGLPIDIHQKNICKLFHDTYGSDTVNKVKVLLDHGAGPFTNLGTRFNCDYEGAPSTVKGVVDGQVIAVDPLSPRYHEILTNCRVFNTLRTGHCPSEELSKCLGFDTVDFAIIINALDHSESPLLAFLESLRTVRVGGISCVYTLINEATNMGGVGFHQWDFKLNASGEWIIENFKTKIQTNVDNALSVFTQRLYTPLNYTTTQHFICYQKTGEVLMQQEAS